MIKEFCPFCHGKADLNGTANSDFRISVDTSDPSYPVIAVEHFAGDLDYTGVIAYCPICGRRLRDER